MTHIFGNYWLSDTGRIISRFMSKERIVQQQENGKYKLKVGRSSVMLSYDEIIKRLPKKRTRNVCSENDSRLPLTKNGVYNNLYRLFPRINIPTAPDKEGVWQTTPEMIVKGIHACPACGNLQPLEFIPCKQCGEFILKK